MKAIVIHGHGGREVLQYETVPTPRPGPGEVLVKVAAAGVNHFDHDIREGTLGITHQMPHILDLAAEGEARLIRNRLRFAGQRLLKPEVVPDEFQPSMRRSLLVRRGRGVWIRSKFKQRSAGVRTSAGSSWRPMGHRRRSR